MSGRSALAEASTISWLFARSSGEVGRPGRTEAVGHGTTDLLTRLDDDGQIGAGGVVQHPGVQ
jgi:hypothetical protein